MNAPFPTLSRRQVVAGGGALIVAASPLARAIAQDGQGATPQKRPLPGSLKDAPLIDTWIRVGADGRVKVLTGKAELGQGIKTALMQVAAEHLAVPLNVVSIFTADTGGTANEGFTAGSHSMQDSGVAIMHAAAQARAILIAEAAKRLDTDAAQLKAQDGAVVAPDGRKLTYGELVSDQLLHVEAQPESNFAPVDSFKIIGQSAQRVDIPAKVTGGAAYVQDMRLPDTLHARVVRPPSYGAKLTELSTSAVEQMPGVVKVVRDGNFLAVIAQDEYRAILAMNALAGAAKWEEKPGLPDQAKLPEMLLGLQARDTAIVDRKQQVPDGLRRVEATYTRPYQSHGSIGPSCAVAQWQGDSVTVWTHTQGVFPDRNAIAEMLRVPQDKVRCVHVEGSGCYGHNGADDVAGDAALIARSVPGKPVRVQWMRDQEHGWEPFGPAMMAKASASLGGDGMIADWNYEVWSNTHSMRPGSAGSLIAAQHIAQPFPVPPPVAIPQPEGGGDRNAIPLYRIPSERVVHHFLPQMPVRVSAMRALGAYLNVFAVESFMDELAKAANEDPVAFRLKHLDDQRAKDVIAKAAESFGWQKFERRNGRGRGFGFARYKNLAAYCAIACEVEIDRESGRARLVRATAAVDSGQVVNPDGLVNQVEGAILQSMSWTLFESVTFDDTRITSVDWGAYPILRFSGVPDSIDVHVINRPGMPFLGSGETGQGPAAGAIANAVADATGQRLRDIPLTPARIKAAIGA